MPDRINEFLPEIKQNRLPGLELGSDFIYPHYAGRSILNVANTVCNFLGAPAISSAGAIHPAMLSGLEGPFQKVILIVMDALALHRFQAWIQSRPADIWQRLGQDGVIVPLTSITPSTTSAALPTFWTGRSAAEHGITGYEMWMKEYGVVANTILHSPMSFINDVGSLQRAGFSPEEALPFTALGTHLKELGIPTCVFQHQSIITSGMSRMFLKDVELQGFSNATDLWINLRQKLESRAREPGFYYVYWSEVDTFSHRYGPDSEYPSVEFASFSQAVEQVFLSRLSNPARAGTLLLLTADHGAASTTPDPHYDLSSHPGLARRLHIRPTGENRLFSLFIKPGQSEAVHEYIHRTWPNQFSLFQPYYAVESGLYGPGQPHPYLLDRLGDLLVAARGGAYLWWSAKENHLRGRHGGLTPDEMLVPFLAAPL